ncbi:MAG: hypothetical protein K0Q71_5285 [Thermomicrobiales bacterium]|nr:hypothetical protein [Thermomicrobiales bacterium]
MTLHAGSCDALGEPVLNLREATYPIGEFVGQPSAVVAETTFTRVPILLGDLLAQPYAINVAQSFDAPDVSIACGDIGGIVDEIGGYVIALPQRNGSRCRSATVPGSSGWPTWPGRTIRAAPTSASSSCRRQPRHRRSNLRPRKSSPRQRRRPRLRPRRRRRSSISPGTRPAPHPCRRRCRKTAAAPGFKSVSACLAGAATAPAVPGPVAGWPLPLGPEPRWSLRRAGPRNRRLRRGYAGG